MKVTLYCYLVIVKIFNILCRKVQNESATGSVSASKVRTVLTIRVEAIDFDTQACVLRVKGRNIAENQYVKVRMCLSPCYGDSQTT